MIRKFSPSDLDQTVDIWQPVFNALSRRTGYVFYQEGAPGIADFETAVMAGKYDIAYMNPYHYIVASRTQGDIPLVRDTGRSLQGVLVVEDNPVNQKVVEKMLAATGMEIDLAEDGSQALERMRITATRLIRSLEREEARPPVPIIALTANVLGQNEEKYLEAGMNGFLPKPVTMEALMTVLNRYLS